MIIPRFNVEIKFKSFFNPNGLKYYNKSQSNELFYYDSATSAIYEYLNSLELSSIKVVGVPLYSCSSVWHAIYKAGFKIKFLDISLSTKGYNLDESILDDVDILVFIHYFGYHYDFQSIKNRYRNLVIISDCTHKRIDIDDNDNISDVKVYSFNFHKPIVAGQGGVLKLSETSRFYKKIKTTLTIKKEKLKTNGIKKDLNVYLKSFFKNIVYKDLLYSIIYQGLIKKEQKFHPPVLDIPINPKKIGLLGKIILGNQLENNQFNKDLIKNYTTIPISYRLNINEDDYLSYFPLIFPLGSDRDEFLVNIKDLKLDSFFLWQYYLANAKFYGYKNNNEYNTKNIISKLIFLPEQLFLDKNKYILENLIKRLKS